MSYYDWRQGLIDILQMNCTGTDDHDGGMEPTKPLPERCEKCQQMYEKISAVIEKVRPASSEIDRLKDQVEKLQEGLFASLTAAQRTNAELSGRLLDLLEQVDKGRAPV